MGPNGDVLVVRSTRTNASTAGAWTGTPPATGSPIALMAPTRTRWCAAAARAAGASRPPRPLPSSSSNTRRRPRLSGPLLPPRGRRRVNPHKNQTTRTNNSNKQLISKLSIVQHHIVRIGGTGGCNATSKILRVVFADQRNPHPTRVVRACCRPGRAEGRTRWRRARVAASRRCAVASRARPRPGPRSCDTSADVDSTSPTITTSPCASTSGHPHHPSVHVS